MNYQAIKEERKRLKKEARKNMSNPFKVGQVLYDSWGYDQTNVNFYQVTEVKPRSIVIHEIKGELIPKSTAQLGMSGKVRPVKDRFLDDKKPLLKPLQILINSTGKIEYYITSRHGWINEYTDRKDGVYCSWYA